MSIDQVEITKIDLERKPWQIVSDVFSTVWSGIVNFFTEEEYDLEKICINITLKVQPYKNILLTPYKYLPKTCLWTVLAPIGYNVLLHCAPLKSTPRFACTTDRFLISTSGDPNLTGADTYCGDKTFKALSSGNVMTLGAVTFGFPNAIRPSCRLTARPVPKPCSCGMRYNKTSTEYPMFVAIVHKDNEHKAICGGTIIDNRHVLTSALCIRDGTDNLLVKVGMLSSSPWSFHKTYQILYSVKHENYSDRHFGFKDVPYDDYDIGLIRLSDVIKFSTFAGAACLPIQFQNFDLTGTNLTYLLFHNFTEYIMLDVKVVSVNMCDALNYTAPEKTQFCNQPSLIGENDMTYIGSGGPVLYKDPDNDMLYVVGIISQVSLQYDQTKHSFEPVYDVKVAPLLGWILKFTTEVIVDEYCQV